jgi:DNA-binding SARP family transcriptional activator
MRPLARHLDATITAILLVGLPIVLAASTGNPLSSQWSSGMTIALLAVWTVWLWCILSLALGVIRHLLNTDRGVRGPIDRLSVAMAGAILAVVAWFPSASAQGSTTPSHGPSPVTQTTTIAASAPSQSYVVAEGDCLWNIAVGLYGDGDLWPLLANANLGHVMTDGQVFTNPSLIYPGWTLIVPPAAGAPTSPAQPAALHPTVLHRASDQPTAIAPPPTPAKGRSSPSTTTHLRATAPRLHALPSPASTAIAPAVILGASTGSGLVLFGLLARRQRRLRRDSSGAPRNDQSADVAIAAQRLERVPLATMLERAVWLADEDGVLDESCLVEINPSGARLYKGATVAWHAPAVDLMSDPIIVDHAPGLVLALGDDGDRSWALVAPQGSSLELSGGDASEFLELALDVQDELAWGAKVFEVTSNEQVADLLTTTDEGVLCYARRVLDEDSGVVILSLTESARVHIEGGWVELRDLDRRFPASHVATPIEPSELQEEPSELSSQDPTDSPTGDLRVVHLLCAQPWIEGLVSPLEANRQRRATELLAYLALHAPQPVTSDRLRSRVLGSSTSDAASKTLFNVASSLRRALGVHDGEPILPRATRAGLYRCGSLITTDVATFESLVDDASAEEDPEVALALLREAFSKIEGAPLDAALMGYEWFDVEGHRGRLESKVERAARQAIDLSLELGHGALAQFVLERARLIVPYSESLAELAMEVAGALEDPDALRRAFREIAALLDELDPGRGPSEALEQRYATLRTQIEASQASLAAIDAAPRNTSPSAPAAL